MKNIIVLLLIFVNIMIFAENLPAPKDGKLYTEFTSYRSALYLKKPIVSSGYIVMNGGDNFLFKQTTPVVIEVRKIGKKLTYKRDKSEAIEITGFGGESIAFLFDSSELSSDYDISKTVTNGNDLYLITPKRKDKVEKIEAIGNSDKLENVKIFFRDKTTIIYEFKNTVTGIIPDQKLF